MSALNNFDDCDEWTPPSDAELKVLEARRERSDKISKLMGQYLLKGYKMLAISCPACDCVLLQDRQSVDYCVACSEVDADTKKDNPAVSVQAAQRTVEESIHRQNVCDNKPAATIASSSYRFNTQSNTGSQTSNQLPNQTSKNTCSDSKLGVKKQLLEVMEALSKKLAWTSTRLNENQSIRDSIDLTKLISEIVSTISNINRLEKSLA